ncbi:hypothetical protein PBY51_021835 [Eleginops maclovinus]|uniref:Uncharacterized protein n=1 Tax=Eleginops maclovinus TaxID=56733 RepID=A0AAN7XGS0_ELEMC|nr:hypothetical protein PBY51_021835 [Eleginops maclovinus]
MGKWWQEGSEEEKKDEEKEEEELGGEGMSKELRAKSVTSIREEDNAVDDEYMEMKDVRSADCESEVTQRADGCVFDAADVLNSTQENEDDYEMSGYVQDNFEFLDQMDCSVLDHMDCSVSYQVNEFSVEPPGHSDDEYEVMEQACPAELRTDLQQQSPTEIKPTRPLSIDSYNRHTKSLSLPYLTSPILGLEDSCSEEEAEADDSDDYSSDEDESMFIKSLPTDFFLNNLTFETKTGKEEGSDGVPEHQSQSCTDRGSRSMHFGFPTCEESAAGDLEQVEGKDEGDKDGLQEKEITKKEEEDQQGRDRLENNGQSKKTEEDILEDSQSDEEDPPSPSPPLPPPPPEALLHCCDDFPPPSEEDFSIMEEVDMLDNDHLDSPPSQEVLYATEIETDGACLEEFRDFSVTEKPTEERDSDEGEEGEIYKAIESEGEDIVMEMKENDESKAAEKVQQGNEDEEMLQRGEKEQESDICRSSKEMWAELEDVVCELVEDEESKQLENKDARESVSGEGDVGEEEEQVEEVSGKKTAEVDEVQTEVRVEAEEESMETTDEKLPDTEMQHEMEEKETNVPKTSEPEEGIQGKHVVNAEAQRHDREEVTSKENNDKADEQRQVQQCIDKHLKEVRCHVEERKEGRKGEESDSSLGGVGRKIVISKNPKVYQVKAVPVVPPKPQHCKFTAQNIRQQQQQQQKERRDAYRERENASRAATEQDGAGDSEEEKREKPSQEREKRRDGDESRNSPLSMCFDEAVAIATMRRGKEKECDKEKERQRDWGNEVQ